MTEIETVAMDADEARDFVTFIRQAQDEIPARVIDAYQRRAWVALGYDSWDAMCTGEGIQLRLPRDERQQMTMELRSAGMSTRAIGSTLGTSAGTVRNDLTAGSGGQNCPPDTVAGLDGKSYASTVQVDEGDEVVDAEVIKDIPEPGAWTSASDALANLQVEPEPDNDPEPARAESEPKKASRRPLTDQFFDAVYDLRKAVERVGRLVDDDRFPRNAQQVAAKHRADLLQAAETIHTALGRLPR